MKKKKTCSTTSLSQKAYERDFCSHVLANPVRYVYTYIYDRQVLLDFSSESLLLIATPLFFLSGKKTNMCYIFPVNNIICKRVGSICVFKRFCFAFPVVVCEGCLVVSLFVIHRCQSYVRRCCCFTSCRCHLVEEF